MDSGCRQPTHSDIRTTEFFQFTEVHSAEHEHLAKSTKLTKSEKVRGSTTRFLPKSHLELYTPDYVTSQTRFDRNVEHLSKLRWSSVIAAAEEDFSPSAAAGTSRDDEELIKPADPLCHPVFCHDSCVTTSGDVYVFGGFTQSKTLGSLFRMSFGAPHDGSLSKGTTKQDVCRHRPSARHSHSLVAWGDNIILFGGDSSPGYLNDLWMFDGSRWHLLCPEEQHLRDHHADAESRPCPRSGQTLICYENKVLLFGGWRGWIGLGDVWSYDLIQRDQWTKWICAGSLASFDKDLSPMPLGRHWHVACNFGAYMYIFGGFGRCGALGDMWRLDLRTKQWSQLTFKEGMAPSRRCRHAGTVCSDTWLVFGGRDVTGTPHNDLWEFDFQTHFWSRIQLNLSPRAMSPSYSEIESPSEPESLWLAEQRARQCSLQPGDMIPLHCHSMEYSHKYRSVFVIGGCDQLFRISVKPYVFRRVSTLADIVWSECTSGQIEFTLGSIGCAPLAKHLSSSDIHEETLRNIVEYLE